MGLYELKKQGFFESLEDIDLDITNEQVSAIKRGLQVILEDKFGQSYLVHISSTTNTRNLQPKDLVIKKIEGNK